MTSKPKPKYKDQQLHIKAEAQLLANLAELCKIQGRKKSSVVRSAIQEMYLAELQRMP